MLTTEEACIDYFYQMKWPDGYHCPRCAYPLCYVIRSRRLPLYQCRSCQHQTSITAGTVMEGSRTPLQKWMETFQLFSEAAGINAVQLSKRIQVTYKTAWAMLHSIREVIRSLHAGKTLSGPAVAGYSFYGRPNQQPYIRHPQEYPVLVGASMGSDGQPSALRLQVIPLEYMDGKRIHRHCESTLQDRLLAPSAQEDSKLQQIRFCHTTGLHNLFRQAVRWINRTFHGIGLRYLQSYWDEYCFRFQMMRQPRPIQDALAELCLTKDFDRDY